jgi:hypothetical protein
VDHVRCLSWWWDVGTHEPKALDQRRHHGRRTSYARRCSPSSTGQASEPYDHWSYAWRVATGQESAVAGLDFNETPEQSIVWLASDEAARVQDQRIVATEFDATAASP